MLGAACSLWAAAATIPLLDPDEARFARTSVEMLRSGDLTVPQFEGRPRLVKPPLLHWLQSWLFSLIGVSEWSARLHASLATLGSMWLLGWIGFRRLGPEGGLWLPLIFITMPLVYALGRVGTLDALLAVHVLAALALDLTGEKSESRHIGWGIGALLGLAFLVKGPVGVLLPLLVMLAGRTATGGDLLPGLRFTLSALTGWALVVLPWGLVFLRRVGSGATGETLRREVFERYFSGTVHTEPFWFYGPTAVAAFLPWVAPIIVAIVQCWLRRREPESKPALYASAGLLAGLLFFSLSRGKVASYILPLAPLAAILVVWELSRQLRAPKERMIGTTLLAATLACVPVLLGLAALPRLEGVFHQFALSGVVIYGVAALIGVVGAVIHRPRWTFGSAAAASAIWLLLAGTVLHPELGRRQSTAGLIEAVPALEEERPLLAVEVRLPSLVFYLDRVPEYLTLEQVEESLLREDRPLWVIVDVDLDSLPEGSLPRLRQIGSHGKFRVFEQLPSILEAADPPRLDAPRGSG
jgi:4-amino-4-deoxy-L-arabinose transferase-like glycosyltransferase